MIPISYYEHKCSEELDIQEELKEALRADCLPKLSPEDTNSLNRPLQAMRLSLLLKASPQRKAQEVIESLLNFIKLLRKTSY